MIICVVENDLGITMSNYSILDINILAVLEGACPDCDIAPVAYLWARERITDDAYAYKAEAFAVEASILNATLSIFLGMAFNTRNYNISLEKLHDLKNYILTRHVSLRFPSEKRSWVDREDLVK